MNDVPETGGGDLLYGMPAIAAHLNIKDQAAYHLAAIGRIPTFKIGRRICARRSSLNAWLDEQEAASNA